MVYMMNRSDARSFVYGSCCFVWWTQRNPDFGGEGFYFPFFVLFAILFRFAFVFISFYFICDCKASMLFFGYTFFFVNLFEILNPVFSFAYLVLLYFLCIFHYNFKFVLFIFPLIVLLSSSFFHYILISDFRSVFFSRVLCSMYLCCLSFLFFPFFVTR